MAWTLFWDMNSGGGRKERWTLIAIEAPQEEAERVFYAKFGHNPNRVTCTCCGEDYSISEHSDLSQATAYHRGCAYDEDQKQWVEKWEWRDYCPYLTLEQFLASGDIKAIPATEINDSDRQADLPRQGYVWMD